MTAQEALNAHPTATVAHVNEAGEWHFCTPPKDFVVVEILTKQELKVSEGVGESGVKVGEINTGKKKK